MKTRTLFDHRKKELFEMLDKYGSDLEFVNKTVLAEKLEIPRRTLYLWLDHWRARKTMSN